MVPSTTATDPSDPGSGTPNLPRLAAALRTALAAGYRGADLRGDLAAGLVVGVVALPLSMALAIASGVPPQHGLYTAIVAGAVIAVLGGSRLQVSGPTAAFVAVLAPIAARHGLGGLLTATLMAGVILVLMGLARFGQLIQFIPYPVTTGFTAGIAVVIGTLQLRDFLGLTVTAEAESFPLRAIGLLRALPTARAAEAGIGLLTLAVLLSWTRITRRIPAPLVAMLAGSLAAAALRAFAPEHAVETIGTRFQTLVDGAIVHGIPRLPPMPGLPWSFAGGTEAPLGLSFAMLRDLVGPALTIAVLGAIESLLSAVVADGLTGDQHDADAELVAQGVGNIVAPFFGGIAATGAIARTATNIRYGARTPLASLYHAGVVLLAVLVFAPWLSHVPMAALAAVLLVVAWNMAEFGLVVRLARIAPRSDTVVLMTCVTLTVLFDMMIAVTAGVILASLLFMRRMADVSTGQLVGESHPAFQGEHAGRVVIYEVAGPLFFGAARRAMSTLRRVRKHVRVVVFDLRAVPVIDASGMVSLRTAAERLIESGVGVVLGGVQPGPAATLRRAGLGDAGSGIRIHATLEAALDEARATAGEPPPA